MVIIIENGNKVVTNLSENGIECIHFMEALADETTNELSFRDVIDYINDLQTKLDPLEEHIFLIDAVFNCKNVEKKEEKGVEIFRYLLVFFKSFKKKFIFFSDLTINQLLSTEATEHNEVLRHFPYWNTKETILFPKELLQLRSPFFNTASENMLAGWALCKKEAIIPGKNKERRKILVFDDDWEEWSYVFELLFGENRTIFFQAEKERYHKLLENDGLKFKDKVVEIIHKNDLDKHPTLIITDLYLDEEHPKATYVKTASDVENISGYKAYRLIREVNKAIPVMIHSTSNKVWNYKLLNTHGIDGWIIKENESTWNNTITTTQLKNQFKEFKNTVSELLYDEEYILLQSLWNDVQFLVNKQNDFSSYWWTKETASTTGSESEKEIKNIVLNTYIQLRRKLRKQKDFEAGFKDTDDLSNEYTYAAIVNMLGKIPEFIYGESFDETALKSVGDENMYGDKVSYHLRNLRNYSAHLGKLQHFHYLDAIIGLKSVLYLLLKESLDESDKGNLPFFLTRKKHELLMNYVSFYNTSIVRNYDSLKNTILKRVQLFEPMTSEEFEEINNLLAGYHKERYSIQKDEKMYKYYDLVETSRKGKNGRIWKLQVLNVKCK